MLLLGALSAVSLCLLPPVIAQSLLRSGLGGQGAVLLVARRSIVSGKAQQLAEAHSMHSIHIFCTNGLSKVYIVFKASVFAITRCSFCEMSRCPSVQVCPKSSPFPVWNSILAMIHIKVWQSFHIWQLQQFQSISYLYT